MSECFQEAHACIAEAPSRSLNQYVDEILNEELNKDTKNKLIIRVDEDINFKYNSFNI